MSILIDVKNSRTPAIGIKGNLGFYEERDLRDIGASYRRRTEDKRIELQWRLKAHYEVAAPLIKRLFEGNGNVSQPMFMRDWQSHVSRILEDNEQVPILWRRLEVTEQAVYLYKQWEEFEHDLNIIKRVDHPLHDQLVERILSRHSIHSDFFSRPPLPHQRAGLAFFLRSLEINGGHICLFDEMRTGKTKQAIDIARHLFTRKFINRVLIICPNSIKRVWRNELLLDAPARGVFSEIIEGTKAKKQALWESLSFFYILNYECARADRDFMYAWQSNFRGEGYLLICDEAHKIKNPDAKQSRAVLGLDPNYSIFMTGTPVANRPEDAFCMTDFVSPGLLGQNVQFFQQRFGVRGGYQGKNIIEYKDLDEVKYRLARISMRRKRSDIMQDVTLVQDRFGDMAGDQKKAYDDMRDQLWAELTNAKGDFTRVEAQNNLVKILRLQQITSGYMPSVPMFPEIIVQDMTGGRPTVIKTPTIKQNKDNVVWFDNNWKLRELDTFIDEYLDDIGKLVIWSRYRPPLELLADRYKEHGSELIIGGMKEQDIYDGMTRFQTDPECRIMVCNILSAEGKGFQSADWHFFWDKWWSPHLNKQAQDRTLGVKKMGEERPTTVISAITSGSIDERLENILEDKKVWADMMLGDTPGEIQVPILDKNTLLYLIAKPEKAEKYRNEKSRA